MLVVQAAQPSPCRGSPHEVGQLVRVAGLLASSPGPEGMYRIPVCIQGGTHQALLDTDCNQTMIHQHLVRPGVLLEASWVKVRCMHGIFLSIPWCLCYSGAAKS